MRPLATSRAAAVVATAPAMPEPPKPALMNEGLFTFNKVLIDAVYDLICFFYPVTGGPRDFARFYVLETVARVPYFAYRARRLNSGPTQLAHAPSRPLASQSASCTFARRLATGPR